MSWPEATVIVSACIGVIVAIIKFIPGRRGETGEQGVAGRTGLMGVPGHNGGVLAEVCELKHAHVEQALDEIKKGIADIHQRLDVALESRKRDD